MTLLRKFVLLITVLALAIAASGFAAFWSFRFLRNELSLPFESCVKVLTHLGVIKRDVEDQAKLIAALASEPPRGTEELDAPTTEPDQSRQHLPGFRGSDPAELDPQKYSLRRSTAAELAAFRRLVASSTDAIDSLERDSWYRSRVGGSTWRNIKARILEAARQAEAQLTTDKLPKDSLADRSRILNEHYQIHELIEKTEQRILSDAGYAVLHGDSIQHALLLWLLSVLLVGALASVLAFILLRRWVSRPVAALREAASHIAQGDLTYRINVQGKDELARLSGEVNHMAEMVHVMQEERIDRERLAAIGGMVRRLVHNVRNPLSGIRGLAELTRMDMPRGSENRDNLDLIVSTVDTFERWLNELLNTTSPTNVNLRSTPVVPWLQSVVEVHRPMAQSKGVDLLMDVEASPETAEFDPTHLDHAVAAIVSNAIEATPEGGRVMVKAQLSTEPGKWEIWIIDQGGGIAKDVVARIFEPHFTTKRQGTGMGLAMSQQVIRAHGGRISLETAPNTVSDPVGAVFMIRLPLLTPASDRTSLVEDSR